MDEFIEFVISCEKCGKECSTTGFYFSIKDSKFKIVAYCADCQAHMTYVGRLIQSYRRIKKYFDKKQVTDAERKIFVNQEDLSDEDHRPARTPLPRFLDEFETELKRSGYITESDDSDKKPGDKSPDG